MGISLRVCLFGLQILRSSCRCWTVKNQLWLLLLEAEICCLAEQLFVTAAVGFRSKMSGMPLSAEDDI